MRFWQECPTLQGIAGWRSCGGRQDSAVTIPDLKKVNDDKRRVQFGYQLDGALVHQSESTNKSPLSRLYAVSTVRFS
jgi:hypothetical protein